MEQQQDELKHSWGANELPAGQQGSPLAERQDKTEQGKGGSAPNHQNHAHFVADEADCSTEDGDESLSYMRRGVYVGRGKNYWPVDYSGYPGDPAGGFRRVSIQITPERMRPRKSILKSRCAAPPLDAKAKMNISFGADQVWNSDSGARPSFSDVPFGRSRSFVFSEEKNGYVDITNGEVEDVVPLGRTASVARTIVDEIQDRLCERKLTTVSILWERFQSHGNMGDKTEGWAPNLGMPRVAMANLPPRYHVKYPGGAPRPTTCGTCGF
ncbi:hypothetical protein TGME49_295360 [Toxoplasma gondii ME49]|uniref:Inner membrane complex protein 18 n=9 Tax=Toxoplasma gondii TaxID=5811 RepID=A0A0F7UNW4_TOXGV|nr:hypothetical protein TGME49_295360 [Toxoplasma gondii ME49]ALA27410.1 inner membrane complex protein 18 [Toxoplasma gondii]EPR57770.1 hypothetical protein TGGT1_295360 [Toxoplasma gondii GT1]ESS29132.1 hypothetical protein TGVEG_295360 [Toxoplasma gondii VEG]KFG35734.1 hypothetical protein TGFOU_295360 [Toxoplasma gondii FOU]KFG37075.1 hypothetical protein TGDOM2_295360 [Toxoplasma gondii GAB2-2007-GAL-DOM2]KFH06064.1 hypothetical protein TGMAS_295360 [Toxoplasma gondii MAS]KYF39083.1 hyp|eukprot:XP_002371485.1 hypothetical protein TGME49_295360 [Toxoplasma gondii ME49]